MTFDELTRSLSDRLGLPDLAANREGMIRLAFAGDVEVDIEPEADGDALHIYTRLGPQTEDPEVLARLLAANLFGRETGGAVIALDDFLKELLLARTFALGTLDADAFLAALEEFVNYAELWRDRLASGDLTRYPEREDAQAARPDLMIRA
ncbi:type III secretion system chaperone [Imhoffiella purpurea]|uniref:Uncharacterized protein n=1 Tax=Imhoffiella purpurea TaxID=1249627 RepID=W9VZ33_9GAMM|nr:type III secretion system chaperone [Imhoffiella purpurea]EXJ15660.1 hypothetical protein D779_1167 [Imhoffiella purpurea]